MTSAIRPNEEKLKQLILYLADKCEDDPAFGRVKLNKLLYFIDAFAYGQFGQPVTGVEYMKQEQGPVPRRLLPVRNEMQRDGLITEREKHISGLSNPLVKVIALKSPDLSAFTAQEIAHIDEIIELCSKATGTKLSDITHRWRGWNAAGIGETIPYEAIFLSDEPPTDYELAHAEELIAKHGWDV